MFRGSAWRLAVCLVLAGAAAGRAQTCLYGEPAASRCTAQRVIPGSVGQHVVLMDAHAAYETGSVCGASVGRLLYFSLTPEVTDWVTVSTCHPATAYDTVLEVRSGTEFCTGGTVAACNDDTADPECGSSCGGANRSSQVRFYATAGTHYLIRVGSYHDNPTGCPLCLGLIVTVGSPCGEPPRNIVCETARELPGTPGTHEARVDLADTPAQPQDFACAANVGHPVWFKFTPTIDGTATFSTCHPTTGYDTVVQAVTGCSGLVASLGCNDDTAETGCSNACGPNRASKVSFAVSAGTEYFVKVGAYDANAAGCDLCLGATLTIAQCTEGTDCDDGNPCTQDRCTAGICANPPVGTGTACPDDGNACTQDHCDGGGACVHPARPAGTACGDPTDTDCTDPDTCNGAGQCVANDAPAGLPCPDDGNACTDDGCDGAGSCTHPARPAGSPCGDPTDTACTDPDTCDGAGLCRPNHEPRGVPCPDPWFCNGPEVCDGFGSCVPGGAPCRPDQVCDDTLDRCFPDCNGNGVSDVADIESGGSVDCDGDLVPDECQPDGDGDTVPDTCDVCSGFDDRADADRDGAPDGCDLCPGFDDRVDTDGDGDPDCIDPDDDGDGMPDEWEAAHHLDPLQDDASLDPDEDGYTNGEEFEAATDPQDPDSHPERITFEENVPQPEALGTQYCANPATSRGVEVLWAGGRIVPAAVGTSSPTHVLTNRFPGDEFGAYRKLEIRFTTGQSFVTVAAGLDRSYAFPVTAVLSAYGSETPGSGFLDHDTLYLGYGPTPVTGELSVSSASGSIRSVVVEFTGPSPGQAAYEVIDDLYFAGAGPACVEDRAAPTVQITTPAADGELFQNPSTPLAFVAADDETGVAAIRVAFLAENGVGIESFFVCGGPGAPRCAYQVYPYEARYDFYTYLPSGTHTIRVEAWDFANHAAQAQRVVHLVPLGDRLNLWARGMEVTQGIQPWVATNTSQRRASSAVPTFSYPDPAHSTQSVPLVAHRTTVVRVYGGVEDTLGGLALEGARARLRCYSDANFSIPCPGSPAGGISPHRDPPRHLRAVTVDPGDDLTAQRQDTSRSWNFVLPDAWTGPGQVYLEAEVEPPERISECSGCADAANRIRVSDVAFETVPHFSDDLVHFVSVERELGGSTFQPTQAEVDAAIEYLSKRYPIDETTLPATASGSWKFTDDAGLDLSKRCFGLHGTLHQSFPNKAGKLAVYALIDTQFPCAGVGGGGVAYGNASRPDSFPHEVGHAVGLGHCGPLPGHGSHCPPEREICAECENNWCEPDWPWPHGTFPSYGFDVLDLTVVAPGTTEADPHDFMSYGGPVKWVSSRNWTRMYNAFTGSALPYPMMILDRWSSARGDGASGLDAGRTAYLVIRGEREEALGRWALRPAYAVDLPAGSHDHPGVGDHRILLLDAFDRILFARDFYPTLPHVDMDGPDALFPPPAFSETLPLPAGVAKVRLVSNGEPLAEILRSEHPPAVELLAPDEGGFGGEPVIRWAGSDEDGDALSFMVQYATASGLESGQDWRTLATDLTAQHLPVRLEDLPGGPDALVRVLATDGLNTTAVISPPFPVAGKPPRAHILSPRPGTVVERGDRILFRGRGSDPEDGLLAPESCRWYSSLDGLLGTGRRLEASNLSVGDHDITLEVEDSQGNPGSDTVRLTVEEPVNIQPVAHAGLDRTTLPGTPVLLDGSGSTDANGDVLYYTWFPTRSPAGSAPALSDPHSVQTNFTADAVGIYDISLVVTDGKAGSVPDTVRVTVAGDPCQGDVDGDGDVDGGDLLQVAHGSAGLALETFASEYGSTWCRPRQNGRE